MSSLRIFLFAPLLSLLFLASCAVPPAPLASSTSTPYTGLTGNWLLADTTGTDYPPVISMALFDNGSALTARGNLSVECGYFTHALIGPVTVPLALESSLAADGSFTMSEAVPTIAGTIQLTIQATSNASGWGGTYAIAGASNLQTCGIASYSGTFTAQQIPPITGTYTGNISLYTNPASVYGFTLNLTQEAPAAIPGSSALSNIPVTGTASVQGISCFTQGTLPAASSVLSNVTGEQYVLNFTMNDGSTLLMQGFVQQGSPSGYVAGSTMLGGSFTVVGGNCDGMYGWGYLPLQ